MSVRNPDPHWHDLLDAIFERSLDAMAVVDPECGAIRTVNPACRRLLGIGDSDPRAHTFDRFLPAAEPGSADRFLARLTVPDGVFPAQLFRTSEGATIEADVTAMTAVWEGAPAVVMILRPVGERRREDARLREAERLDRLREVAGGVAHDFNNLMMAIVGNAQLGMMSLLDDHSARKRLEQIVATAEKAAELTERLLQFSGRTRQRRAPTDLSSAARTVVDDYRRNLQPNQHVRLEISDDLPRVMAIEGSVDNILRQLLSNAAEALSSDGGEIIVRAEGRELDPEQLEGLIAVDPLASRRWVVLDVIDDGIGIDPEIAPRIFDPFFTTKLTGRGLGLASVLGSVRSSGGAIAVQSEAGCGSRLTVLLEPVDEVEVVSDSVSQSGIGRCGWPRGSRILVADTHTDIRRVTVALLEGLGFVCEEAVSSEAVLDRLRLTDDIDLVICDRELPGPATASSVTTIRRGAPDLPMIVVSGVGQLQPDDLRAAEPVVLLEKPFRASTLLEALESLRPLE